MTNAINLLDRKLSRIKSIISGATNTANELLRKHDDVGQSIDQIGADIVTMRDDISKVVQQVADLLGTPNLSDEKRAAIMAVASECDDFQLTLEAMAQDISAELQARAAELSGGSK